MSLFEELSDFIGSTFQARDIEFKGKTKKFFFRELSADQAEELFGSVSDDPKKNKGLRNRVLARIVVDEHGNDTLSEKEAGKLPNDLANKLQAAALEVNGVGQKADEAAKKD